MYLKGEMRKVQDTACIICLIIGKHRNRERICDDITIIDMAQNNNYKIEPKESVSCPVYTLQTLDALPESNLN